MPLVRLTTPRRAWLPEPLESPDLLLACPACGQSVLWTFHELKPLMARSVKCEKCGTLAQVPDVTRIWLDRARATASRSPAPDPEAVKAQLVRPLPPLEAVRAILAALARLGAARRR